MFLIIFIKLLFIYNLGGGEVEFIIYPTELPLKPLVLTDPV